MSHTPNFDAKINAVIDALPAGKDAEICRKFRVPPIKMDPTEQLDLLTGFNTGMAFFWKPHMKTGVPLLSAIHPDTPIPVVTEEEWVEMDATTFGQEIDLAQPVFDQLWGLVTRVPHNPTRNLNCTQSVAVGTINANDCYCVSASYIVNRCLYGYAMLNGEDCIDSGNGMNVARSYQSGGSNDISDCQYVYESKGCLNSSFLFDCWNCEFCFGATNQRNKRFLFFNEQLDEAEYKKRLAEIDLSDASVANVYIKRFMALWRAEGVWPEAFGYGNTEAEGEHVFGCVRCQECFWQNMSVDCYRCRLGASNSGCAYTSGAGSQQDSYMTTGGTFGSGNKFCVGATKCIGCEYCFNCRECENCFGCVGLQHKKFCIFNKQYTEEEYWRRLDELKCQMLEAEEYGSFFPAKFSPCGLQFSAGEIYVGYSAERLKQYGAPYLDPKRGQVFAPHPQELQPIEADSLPLRLDDVDSSLFVGKAIHDPECDRLFTILPSEFETYKAKRWPLPRRHFTTRLIELVRRSNSPMPKDAECAACHVAITTYRNFTFPERTVYCRSCYLKFLETR